MFLHTTERNQLSIYFENRLNDFYKVKVPAERQKLNRQQKEKYLNSIFNTQTLKNLVQTPSYINPSINNQKQVTLVGIN